ncbi:MAG: LysR family transcriptional regulator [Desulfobacteraceae bacterium]|nr:MAG: LysR family transcriptional regulator [Desulfobacteraceae bacterium]
MHLNLNQLRAFYLAAKEKNITKAAETLFVTQPAVTMQIKSLEASLSLKLLRRRGKNIELTDAGKVLFGYAQRIFEIAEEMEHVMKGLFRCGPGVIDHRYHQKLCKASHAGTLVKVPGTIPGGEGLPSGRELPGDYRGCPGIQI